MLRDTLLIAIVKLGTGQNHVFQSVFIHYQSFQDIFISICDCFYNKPWTNKQINCAVFTSIPPQRKTNKLLFWLGQTLVQTSLPLEFHNGWHFLALSQIHFSAFFLPCSSNVFLGFFYCFFLYKSSHNPSNRPGLPIHEYCKTNRLTFWLYMGEAWIKTFWKRSVLLWILCITDW